jgi:Predicted transcriptional regulator
MYRTGFVGVVADLVGAVRPGREVDDRALLELPFACERAQRGLPAEQDQELLRPVVEVEDHEVAGAELVEARTEKRARRNEPLRRRAAAGPVLLLLAPGVVPDVRFAHAMTLADKEAIFCHVYEMRATRLVSLLLLLQTRGQLTAAELAEQLETSVRTIHRDVESLAAAGVPVEAVRGPAGATGSPAATGHASRV